MQKLLLLSVTVMLLGACAMGETVYMKHPGTGDMVKCGGDIAYGNIPAGNDTNLLKLRFCIDDFKEQGYKRMPKK